MDVAVIHLGGRGGVADYMVVASGASSRQVGGLARRLAESLKRQSVTVAVEGATHGDWVLLDAGDVIVHLFRPEVRAFYKLEKLWSPLVGDHAAMG